MKSPYLQEASSLHFQIFVDGVGAECAGGGFDDEDAFASGGRRGSAAALDDFLGGGRDSNICAAVRGSRAAVARISGWLRTTSRTRWRRARSAAASATSGRRALSAISVIQRMSSGGAAAGRGGRRRGDGRPQSLRRAPWRANRSLCADAAAPAAGRSCCWMARP